MKSWGKRTGRWQLTALVLLAVVTVAVSALAIQKNRSPIQQAVPAPTTTPQSSVESSPSSSLSHEPSVSPSPTPTPSPTSLPPSPLAPAALALSEPDASVLVLGDGSGNEDDEWVSVWAHDFLATHRSVDYAVWDRESASYSSPEKLGSGPKLSVWNGSVRGPDMEQEPARIAKAWEDVDVVLLSYGHRQYPRYIADHMAGVLKAVRAESQGVPVVVILQNPDPASTADAQTSVVKAIAEWASSEGLPTVDVYGGFPEAQGERDALVEKDGSPNVEGSKLFAAIIAEALTAP